FPVSQASNGRALALPPVDLFLVPARWSCCLISPWTKRLGFPCGDRGVRVLRRSNWTFGPCCRTEWSTWMSMTLWQLTLATGIGIRYSVVDSRTDRIFQDLHDLLAMNT